MRDGRMQHGGDAMFRSGGIVEVLRIEHGDDRNGAGPIHACPLALHQRVLYGEPMVGSIGVRRVERRDSDGLIVHEVKKLAELAEVHAHLVDKLAQSHLLRSGELIEVAAVGASIFDRLDGGHAQQRCRLVVGDLRRERTDLSVVTPDDPPGREVVVEAVEDLIEARRGEPSRLPQLGGRRLDEGMRIERVRLQVLPLRQIEAEAGADEGTAGLRIRISSQNPAFMAAIGDRGGCPSNR
jgi:hypothetical protein